MVISAICLVLFPFPSFTFAHAYIIKSTPYDNEILGQTLKKVSIQFDETVQSVHNSIQVYDAKGNRVDRKNGHVNAKNTTILECGLNQSLPNGTYRIQWNVISNDGHPVQGVIPFQIGTGDKNQVDRTVNRGESKGYTPHFDLIIIRWIQYFSNACFVGVLFFRLFVMPKELLQNVFVKNTFSKIIIFTFLFLLLSIFLNLPLMATIELTTSWSNALNIQTLHDLIGNTTFGTTWVIQVAVLFLIAIIIFLLSAKKIYNSFLVWFSLILGIGLLFTKSLTSHAASSANPIVTVGMDFFHLLSASIWIGSLVAFVAFIPLSRKSETKSYYLDLVRRFFKWGIILIIVLTITGVFGSFSYVPNLRSLVFTNYGRVLLGKVILLAIMIIFAIMNFLKGRSNNEKGLSVSLWGEVVTGMIVLILSVLLANLPTAMSSPGPINVTKTVNNGNQVTLFVSPNVIGENTFEVYLKDSNGQAMKNIAQVTLTFTSIEMPMGDDTSTLSKVKDGKFRANGMDFNMAGRWNVHVHALTKDLNSIDTDIQCMVGSQS